MQGVPRSGEGVGRLLDMETHSLVHTRNFSNLTLVTSLPLPIISPISYLVTLASRVTKVYTNLLQVKITQQYKNYQAQ